MLKTTKIDENSEPLRVQLHRRYTREYIPEVEKALSGQGTDTQKVVLDLAHATFVDRAAMKFLCGAKSMKITVVNIPSYVKLWIEQEVGSDSAHSSPSEN